MRVTLSIHIKSKSIFPGQQYLSKGAEADPWVSKVALSNDPVHFNVFLYFSNPLTESF